jgi:hypothetical protein
MARSPPSDSIQHERREGRPQGGSQFIAILGQGSFVGDSRRMRRNQDEAAQTLVDVGVGVFCNSAHLRHSRDSLALGRSRRLVGFFRRRPGVMQADLGRSLGNEFRRPAERVKAPGTRDRAQQDDKPRARQRGVFHVLTGKMTDEGIEETTGEGGKVLDFRTRVNFDWDRYTRKNAAGWAAFFLNG